MKVKKWEVCVFISMKKKLGFVKVQMALEVWREIEIEIDTETSL